MNMTLVTNKIRKLGMSLYMSVTFKNGFYLMENIDLGNKPGKMP